MSVVSLFLFFLCLSCKLYLSIGCLVTLTPWDVQIIDLFLKLVDSQLGNQGMSYLGESHPVFL